MMSRIERALQAAPREEVSTIPALAEIVPWHGPAGWRGQAVSGYERFSFADLPWAELRREGDRAEIIGARIECVKASQSRRVLRISRGGETLFAKRYLINNWRRYLGNRIAGTKAAREFDLGHRLLKTGIATPRPLACAEHLKPSANPVLPPASYLLTLEWPNAGSVKAWLSDHRDEAEPLWSALAHFLADAHARGFYHDDCSAEHILISRDAAPGKIAPRDFAFIDIDNGRLDREPVNSIRRHTNLFQILRSLGVKSFPLRQREFFIAEYLKAAGRSDEARQCRDAIDRIAARKIGRSVFAAR